MKEISNLTAVFTFLKGKLNMSRRRKGRRRKEKGKKKKNGRISLPCRGTSSCGNAFTVFLSCENHHQMLTVGLVLA